MEREILENIRSAVKSQVGNRVKVKVNRGRHRIDISEGVLSEAYPSVFVVEIDKNEENEITKRLSFSYIDVITKNVQMMLVQS